MVRKPGFIDVTLRDAHQCLWSTRMTTEMMTPILSSIEDVGYSCVNVLDGAVFEAAAGTPIQLHSHCQSGLAPEVYSEATKTGFSFVHTAARLLAELIRYLGQRADLAHVRVRVGGAELNFGN